MRNHRIAFKNHCEEFRVDYQLGFFPVATPIAAAAPLVGMGRLGKQACQRLASAVPALQPSGQLSAPPWSHGPRLRYIHCPTEISLPSFPVAKWTV